MPRPIANANVAFGLVSIPVKLYSASQASESISFNLLHKDCGARLKQYYLCSKDEERVERTEMIKGFEFARGQYVTFTDEELKTIEEKATQEIAITEFVPTETVDPIYFDKAYYLGPDRGGERAYRLLAEAMEQIGRWAIARYAARGKQYLVVIRPMGNGLAMQQLHYADEVRPWSEIEVGDVAVKENELKLAILLADQVSSERFDPASYQNETQSRLKEIIQQKINGHEIALSEPEPARGEVVDLMEALKKSLEQTTRRSAANRPVPGVSRKGPRRAERSEPTKQAAPRALRSPKSSRGSR